jgi:DNA-3-methyladenine glycosylase
MASLEPLPQRFYQARADRLARAVLGKRIHLGEILLRITETEAYLGPEDSAAHARFGRTDRTAPLFGPPGHAYVYLCYGIHWMLNLVAGPAGSGAAVLIRACEPLEGIDRVRARRGNKDGPILLSGPGKVGAALGLDRSYNDHPLFVPGGLTLLEGPAPSSILCGPRVGIDYASPRDRRAKLRFAAGDTRWVSAPLPLERWVNARRRPPRQGGLR